MFEAPTDRRYLALLAATAVLAAGSAVLADDIASALLGAAVAVLAVSLFWRGVRSLSWLDEIEYGGADAVTITTQQVIADEVSAEAKTAQGTVESWDQEAGWGVLSSPELSGGAFAHFSVVEEEGYRKLVPGNAVEFDYVDAAPGGQDGCPYVAERVRSLEQ